MEHDSVSASIYIVSMVTPLTHAHLKQWKCERDSLKADGCVQLIQLFSCFHNPCQSTTEICKPTAGYVNVWVIVDTSSGRTPFRSNPFSLALPTQTEKWAKANNTMYAPSAQDTRMSNVLLKFTTHTFHLIVTHSSHLKFTIYYHIKMVIR